MATTQQLERWCAHVLEIITGGEHNVDQIIRKRQSRMGTLMAIKHLQKLGVIARYGNSVQKL